MAWLIIFFVAFKWIIHRNNKLYEVPYKVNNQSNSYIKNINDEISVNDYEIPVKDNLNFQTNETFEEDFNFYEEIYDYKFPVKKISEERFRSIVSSITVTKLRLSKLPSNEKTACTNIELFETLVGDTDVTERTNYDKSIQLWPEKIFNFKKKNSL